jgi:hypothetical protein
MPNLSVTKLLFSVLLIAIGTTWFAAIMIKLFLPSSSTIVVSLQRYILTRGAFRKSQSLDCSVYFPHVDLPIVLT